LEKEISFGKIFPNPANELVHIKVNEEFFNEHEVNVIFTDLLGRKISVPQKTGDGLTYDISELSRGVYMIVLSQDNKRVTAKLVKH
jgi:hypothetical protein